MHEAMRDAGFAHTHVINFLQPVYPSGWWSATLAARGPLAPRLAAVDTEHLETRYYNRRIHEAAFANGSFIERRLADLD